MNKVFKCVIFFVILNFVFALTVNAECSYQERKDLLNLTKKTEIFFEVDKKLFEGDSSAPDYHGPLEGYYLILNVTNVTEDFFVKIQNHNNSDEVIYVSKEDLVDNLFTVEIGNILDKDKYDVTFMSYNNNCLGWEIRTTTVDKPIYNKISEYVYCENEMFSKSKYCKTFIDKPFDKSESEIMNYMEKQIEEAEKDTDEGIHETFIDKALNYSIYVGIFVVFIVIIVFSVIFINKKRSKL